MARHRRSMQPRFFWTIVSGVLLTTVLEAMPSQLLPKPASVAPKPASLVRVPMASRIFPTMMQ